MRKRFIDLPRCWRYTSCGCSCGLLHHILVCKYNNQDRRSVWNVSSIEVNIYIIAQHQYLRNSTAPHDRSHTMEQITQMAVCISCIYKQIIIHLLYNTDARTEDNRAVYANDWGLIILTEYLPLLHELPVITSVSLYTFQSDFVSEICHHHMFTKIILSHPIPHHWGFFYGILKESVICSH